VAEATLGGLEATGVVASSPLESPLIVEVEEDRPKDEVKGARWVSFNSALTVLAIALLNCGFHRAERGCIEKEEREGDQLPVNILLVSFQDIVAVDVCFQGKKKKSTNVSQVQC
jgi:hypothetical protein